MRRLRKSVLMCIIAVLCSLTFVPLSSMAASYTVGELTELYVLDSDKMAVGFEVTNNNLSYAINFGMKTMWYDEYDRLIGSSSSYIPALDAQETAFLYTVDYYNSDWDSCRCTYFYGSLEGSSIVDDLFNGEDDGSSFFNSLLGLNEISAQQYMDCSFTAEDDYVYFQVQNTNSSYSILMPEITILFKDPSGTANTVYSFEAFRADETCLSPRETFNISIYIPEGYTVSKVYKTGVLSS